MRAGCMTNGCTTACGVLCDFLADDFRSCIAESVGAGEAESFGEVFADRGGG